MSRFINIRRTGRCKEGLFSECRRLFSLVLEGILLLVILIVIPYSWALILALLTAILLDGLVRMIGETAKLHRFWAVLISFVLYVGGLMSITYYSFSVLIKKVIVYSEEFPGFIRRSVFDGYIASH